MSTYVASRLWNVCVAHEVRVRPYTAGAGSMRRTYGHDVTYLAASDSVTFDLVSFPGPLGPG